MNLFGIKLNSSGLCSLRRAFCKESELHRSSFRSVQGPESPFLSRFQSYGNVHCHFHTISRLYSIHRTKLSATMPELRETIQLTEQEDKLFKELLESSKQVRSCNSPLP